MLLRIEEVANGFIISEGSTDKYSCGGPQHVAGDIAELQIVIAEIHEKQEEKVNATV